MEKIKMLFMRCAAKMALVCSAMTIFATCSGWKDYEPKVDEKLKREIQEACGNR